MVSKGLAEHSISPQEAGFGLLSAISSMELVPATPLLPIKGAAVTSIAISRLITTCPPASDHGPHAVHHRVGPLITQVAGTANMIMATSTARSPTTLSMSRIKVVAALQIQTTKKQKTRGHDRSRSHGQPDDVSIPPVVSPGR